MRRGNERICSELHHLSRQSLREGLDSGVEVAEHCVAPPPAHRADGVSVETCEEESHCSAGDLFHSCVGNKVTEQITDRL